MVRCRRKNMRIYRFSVCVKRRYLQEHAMVVAGVAITAKEQQT